MERKQITALPTDEWCILHAIRISKNAYNGPYEIFGDILYERKLSEYINAQQKQQATASPSFLTSLPHMYDEFDELIQKTVKATYPNAQYSQKLIIFDVEKEDLSIKLRRPKQEVCFYYVPNIDFSDACNLEGKTFIRYRLSMNIYADWGNADMFKNEGFFRSYELSEQEMMEKIMNDAKYVNL